MGFKISTAMLRRKSNLVEIKCNEARWSSLYSISQYFQRIREFNNDADFPALESLQLSDPGNRYVDSLIEKLVDSDSVAVLLHKSSISLPSARVVFDGVRDHFLEFENRLARTAAIVEHHTFKTAVIKVQNRLESELT